MNVSFSSRFAAKAAKQLDVLRRNAALELPSGVLQVEIEIEDHSGGKEIVSTADPVGLGARLVRRSKLTSNLYLCDLR